MGELCYFKVMDSERVSESISSFREGHVVQSFGGGKEAEIRAM